MTNPGSPSGSELELSGTFGSRKRSGAWVVPASIRIHQRMGSTELDFTQATFDSPTVQITVDMIGGSIEFRLPAGAVASMNGLSTTFASTQDHRKDQPAQGTPHLQISGKVAWGSLEIRGPK